MKQSKTLVNIVRFILSNGKWIMLVILLLNLFAFGYWEKMYERGLGGEETLWGAIIVVVMVLFFVFDKVWKRACNKICDSL